MRIGRVMQAGPTRISGRSALASLRIRAEAVSGSSATASASKAWAVGVDGGDAISLSSTSVGRPRCTGPGRPERAMRIALATSAARVSALAQVQAALHTGAAISACRISWNAPCPS